jgi:hypothetical protein
VNRHRRFSFLRKSESKVGVVFRVRGGASGAGIGGQNIHDCWHNLPGVKTWLRYSAKRHQQMKKLQRRKHACGFDGLNKSAETSEERFGAARLGRLSVSRTHQAAG